MEPGPGSSIPMTTIPRVEPRSNRLKRCALCGAWWPISCYSRDRQHPDGHDNRCRACRSEYRRSRGEYARRRRSSEE
jgi:hypothetical protein